MLRLNKGVKRENVPNRCWYRSTLRQRVALCDFGSDIAYTRTLTGIYTCLMNGREGEKWTS